MKLENLWVSDMLTITFESLFKEFALLMLIAVTVGLLATRLRQPLIVAFIAVGILVGPPGLGIVEHSAAMELLAEFGIAILLFVVGLKLDLNLIRALGPVAVATGIGQITFTSLFVFGISQFAGLSVIHSLYVAAGMSFSSTIIIVKLLSDKREIDSLHGRIAIGFLIVQDIMVVLTMILITASGNASSTNFLASEIVFVALKGATLLVFVGFLIRYLLPVILPQVARSSELLVLFSIALAVTMAAGSDLIGFSKEVGAFLGGVAIASTPYRDAAGSRLVSVRDFLLLFFFISLGSQLNLQALQQQIPLALVLSVFVLIGNPLIVLSIMGFMGFRKRTGFLSGLAVAQISEFSLILAALGVTLGHITTDIAGLITLVALITITLSTYMILYSHQIYERVSPLLQFFERRAPSQEARLQTTGQVGVDVLVFGLGRYGSNIANQLSNNGLRLLGVDFDPVLLKKCQPSLYPCLYGDAEDPEFLTTLPLRDVRWIVSTINDSKVNSTLLEALRNEGFNGKVAVTTHHLSSKNKLETLGSDLVLLPFEDAATQAVEKITAELQKFN